MSLLQKNLNAHFLTRWSLVKGLCYMQLKTKAGGHSEVCDFKQKYVGQKINLHRFQEQCKISNTAKNMH